MNGLVVLTVVDTLGKGMVHIPVAWSGSGWDFITLFRMGHNLKSLIVYFCNSTSNVFRLWLTMGNSNHGHLIHGI